MLNETDVLNSQIQLGDRVCFYWQTNFFGKMISGIVTDIIIKNNKNIYTILTNHGSHKKYINEIVKVG